MAAKRKSTAGLATQRFRETESPDPIALTPVPTQRTRTRRYATSPSTSHMSGRSSPGQIVSSTQHLSSEVGQLPKARLRSGRPRRSGGFAPLLLGDEDLVVPSDEEEFEAWAEGKRGESSRMAQERLAARQRRTRSSPPANQFIPLFSPERQRSPPLERQSSWSQLSETSATLPLSINGSVNDSFATIILTADDGDRDTVVECAAEQKEAIAMDQDLPTTTGSHDVEAGVGSESGEGRAPPLSPRNTRHSPHCAPIVKDEIHSLRAVTPPMKRSRSLCSPSPTDEGPAAIKEEQQSINPVLPSSTSPRQPTPSPAAPRTPVKQPPLSQVSTNGPVFTPSQPRSQGTPRTPFLESQIGPHNSYLFGEADAFASQSPMGSTGTPGRPSVLSGSLTNGGLISHHGEATGGSDEARESEHLPETAHILVPETVAPTRDGPRLSGLANQAPANQSRPPDSSPDALDLINRRSPSLTPPPETVTPFPPVPQAAAAPAAPVDPALERFRTARSFRTRTTLQLQPYTRERALYEAALRKGGMFKAKRSFAIPRDATQPDDEDGEEYHEGQERSTADPSSSQAIVIAPSLPPREPSLVPLIEADYDEYLMLHRRRPDSAVSISDLSQVTRDGLQEIAKRRIEADKEAARKAREAKRLKKRFERLLREQERGDPDDETYRPMPAKIPPARKRPTPMQQRTPSRSAAPAKSVGGRVTYSNRLRRPVEPSSESEASAGVRPSNTTRPTPSAQNDPSPSPAPLDFGLGPIDGASSPQLVESSDSDLSNSESTSGSDAPQDKRAKIARRMLPAAMLRRLEQEAARKEREKDSARRKAERRRTPSPVRPGRAIVRHGGGDGVDFADFIDSVADGRSSSHSPVATPLRRHPDESDSDGDRPIVIDSSSGDSDSQAEEDHGGHGGGGGGESLAQLYRGDFESLVAGKGRLPNRKRTSALDRVRADHRTDSRSRRHRPALGLVKQTRAPTSRGYNKSYVQTRLDFEPDSKPSHGEKRKRKHLQPTSPVPRYSTKRDVQRPRPAIRLDDHVIFATDDFAFDDHASAEAPIARPAKRPFTKAKSSSAIGVETLDAGIGKARSWAYLDKLSVDFGISPLPSGLYCSSMSAAGSGRLAELVEIANGRREVTPQGCVAYGVELYPSLSADAVQAVVPIIFDKMYEATTARVLSKEAEDVDIKPIRFFADYIVHIQDGGNDLRSNLSDVTTAFSDKLDLLDLPSGKAGRHARAAMLSIRWAIVELAACLAAVSSDTSMIARSTAPLLSLLLTTGFDKAIRPLKKIIRGESDSAEISDPVLTTWVAVLHVLQDVKYDTFLSGLTEVIDAHFPADQVGPLAAERIWYLVFGLCALHQFDVHGRTSADYVPMPRWAFVRRAIGLIKISHNEEAEEGAHLDQLQGRDRYIKIMLARCVRLSSVWQWPFDRESFSIATKDLGVIFKDRQYRNLPTESPVDFPAFISQFNMALTAAPAESKRESAFELYLRLVCVAASDLIAASQSLSEAQQAEKDVQRLVMSIMPVSPVKFDRLFPPTPRQLGQLINRYSTMVAATYFSPSLLSWLLSCSKKWVAFESADFDSRQVSIRGLMYVAVACRHHGQSLHLVVDRLAEILSLLQKELDQQVKASAPVNAPSRLEVQRTMVLVVSCVRQIILHDSFDPTQTTVSFPDPSLLHESWTTRVFALDLSKDLKCSSEVVATIQAFLDTRLKAMPPRAKRAREEKIESQDEFGSLEFELDDTTLMQLGGGEADDDPVQKQDDHFAKILESVVCPRIYRLLSDMLPAVSEDTVVESEDEAAFMARLTKCFADCAAILVVDHRCLDWSTFIGPFGRMSWSRLGDDQGRLQVGLRFMLNVAKIDPAAFLRHEDEFVSLLFQALVASRLDVEHEYFMAIMNCDKAAEYPLLTAIDRSLYLDGLQFMENRIAILEVILLNISDQLASKLDWATSRKPFMYRCLNLLVSSLVSNDKTIHPDRVLHKEEYRAFCLQVLAAMRRVLGDEIVNPSVIPAIKHFL